MTYITRSTKTKSIVASAITVLALITLIMLSTLLDITNKSRIIMCLIYTLTLMLVVCIWHGGLEIEVFNDYRSKKKLLCADGILSICMGILLGVCGALFGFLQATNIISGAELGKADIRYFLFSFLLIMATWKTLILIKSIKEKRFDWWIILVEMILWFSLGITCLISVFLSSLAVISWFIIFLGWCLIITNIFNNLFSYVIKVPTYLEYEGMEQEIEDGKSERKETLKRKLEELKDLRDNKLISDEEYKEKRRTMIDEF